MNFSVIITTGQQPHRLQNTLQSLRRQTFTDFEVLVVHSSLPEPVLTDFTADLRFIHSANANLSKARNLGIRAAVGEVVAFLDDKTEADSLWLQNLAQGYDSPRIGGVGGFVYGDTGYDLRHEYAVVDRRGNFDRAVRPPLWAFNHAGGDQFVCLATGNCSFRRDLLVEIGGFNEEIDSPAETAEVCIRLIEHGWWLQISPHACVFDRSPGNPPEALPSVSELVGQVSGPKRTADESGSRSGFLPFSTLQPTGTRMTVVFVSQEVPPGCGGIGRFTWDLAVGFAQAGHEIHLITTALSENRIDFESGMWIHRIVPLTEGVWKQPGQAPVVAHNLGRAAAIHREVRRIASTRPVDIVSAPIWDTEGIFCQFDPSLKTVLTLETSLRTMVNMNPSWRTITGMKQVLALEEEVVRTARFVTSPSQAMLDKIQRESGAFTEGTRIRVTPLGVEDHSRQFVPQPADGKIRIVSVGRIEKRKGPDLLLAAAAEILPEFPEAEIHFLGNDQILAEGTNLTYRQQFEKHCGHLPFAGRVFFRGLVSEAELHQAYADCDIFCLPARYESFGLVLVEAMSFGKPVIASATGGMTEIVEDERTGLLIYPDHVPSLSLALRRLLADAKLRNRMGIAARQRYENCFTAKGMLDRTIAAYRDFAGLTESSSPGLSVVSARRVA